jgi:hypothetical protein
VNSHDVTVLGYLVVLLAGIGLQLLATNTRAPVPPLGKVIAWAMSTRTRRVGILVAWAWVGLHFFGPNPERRTRPAAIPLHSPRPISACIPVPCPLSAFRDQPLRTGRAAQPT